VTASISKWIVVDVDMNRWDSGLGTTLSNATCSLTEVIEGKTIWWNDAVGISIVIVLINTRSVQLRERC